MGLRWALRVCEGPPVVTSGYLSIIYLKMYLWLIINSHIVMEIATSNFARYFRGAISISVITYVCKGGHVEKHAFGLVWLSVDALRIIDRGYRSY